MGHEPVSTSDEGIVELGSTRSKKDNVVWPQTLTNRNIGVTTIVRTQEHGQE